MTATRPAVAPEFRLREAGVAGRVEAWGSVARPPDPPGPAFLIVAIRPEPTSRHPDPVAVDYWVDEGGRGVRRSLEHSSSTPRSEDFSWGLIRLVDRLGISNGYLTFGGHLDAAMVDGSVVVAFASPAPLLRRGGHAHGCDHGADVVGAFFGRMMAAVDVSSGVEAAVADADPMTRYASFVRDADQRLPIPGTTPDADLGRLLHHEAGRLADVDPVRWAAAGSLLAAIADA